MFPIAFISILALSNAHLLTSVHQPLMVQTSQYNFGSAPVSYDTQLQHPSMAYVLAAPMVPSFRAAAPELDLSQLNKRLAALHSSWAALLAAKLKALQPPVLQARQQPIILMAVEPQMKYSKPVYQTTPKPSCCCNCGPVYTPKPYYAPKPKPTVSPICCFKIKIPAPVLPSYSTSKPYYAPTTKSYSVPTPYYAPTSKPYPVPTTVYTTAYPTTKYTVPTAAPTYATTKPSYIIPKKALYPKDLYSSSSDLNQTMSTALEVNRTKRDITVSQGDMVEAMQLVETLELQHCVARVICELSCDSNQFGHRGEIVYRNLFKVQGAEGLKAASMSMYKNAVLKGLRFKKRKNCDQCGQRYPNCKADSRSLVDLAAKVTIV